MPGQTDSRPPFRVEIQRIFETLERWQRPLQTRAGSDDRKAAMKHAFAPEFALGEIGQFDDFRLQTQARVFSGERDPATQRRAQAEQVVGTQCRSPGVVSPEISGTCSCMVRQAARRADETNK
jgi:hypothetical protein